MSDIEPGQRIGDFEILQIAGRGGMGVVYRARQVSVERIVAFKLIAAEITAAPDYLARFAREARVAAAVEHPHVVSVYGAGRHGDRPYIAMQWVDGDDLSTLIEEHGPMEPERACLIASQLASALDAIHERGLMHRDLKPANVLRRRVKGRDHVYLTDFGIAKYLLQETAPLTKTGYLVGTPGYIAPECIRGAEGDNRADVYALGCVVFECLAGERSFTAGNEITLYWAHANDPRPKLSERRPHLGERFDAVLEKVMAIEPFERHQSATEFADALQAALHSGVRPRPTTAATSSISPAPPTVPSPADMPAPARDPFAVSPPTPTTVRQTASPPPPAPTPAYAAVPVAEAPAPPPRRGLSPVVAALLGVVALAGVAVAALLASGTFSGSEKPTASSTTPVGARATAAGTSAAERKKARADDAVAQRAEQAADEARTGQPSAPVGTPSEESGSAGAPITYTRYTGPAFEARVPTGTGWGSPSASEPTPGRLFRTNLRGPGGLFVIIDYTPFEAAVFGGRFRSRTVVGQTAFGTAVRYVFQGGSLPECQRSSCYDYIINDRSTGRGFGVLAGGGSAAAGIARTVAESVTPSA